MRVKSDSWGRRTLVLKAKLTIISGFGWAPDQEVGVCGFCCGIIDFLWQESDDEGSNGRREHTHFRNRALEPFWQRIIVQLNILAVFLLLNAQGSEHLLFRLHPLHYVRKKNKTLRRTLDEFFPQEMNWTRSGVALKAINKFGRHGWGPHFWFLFVRTMGANADFQKFLASLNPEISEKLTNDGIEDSQDANRRKSGGI